MMVLENMIIRETEYKREQMQGSLLINGRPQKNITNNMREILIDWLMEVSEEFMIKRDTLYISVNFIDRYLLMADYEIPKVELQLLGVTSLFIACKVEEVFIPRINDFALATDGGYTKEQILDMEFKVMKTLRYKLHPITMCTWANWYLNMWDIYAEQNLRYIYALQPNDLTFKSPNEQSYQRFRAFMQVMDCIMLNQYSN